MSLIYDQEDHTGYNDVQNLDQIRIDIQKYCQNDLP